MVVMVVDSAHMAKAVFTANLTTMQCRNKRHMIMARHPRQVILRHLCTVLTAVPHLALATMDALARLSRALKEVWEVAASAACTMLSVAVRHLTEPRPASPSTLLLRNPAASLATTT